MHLKRWISGLIAFIVAAALIYNGGTAFTVFIGLVCLITLSEYFRITFDTRAKTLSGFILILGFMTSCAMVWAAHQNALDVVLIVIALNLIICGTFSLTQFGTDPVIMANMTRQVAGVSYIPLFLSFAVMIRNSTDGMAWIFLIIVVIFSGDIGAFYAGRRFGKHKLCPNISPGKTIEGAIGGLATNIFSGIIFKLFFLPTLNWGSGMLLFFLMGTAGQAGDLFESEFKRSANIKDSGFIMPGHGGMLDRIDALLFAIPVAYIFKLLY